MTAGAFSEQGWPMPSGPIAARPEFQAALDVLGVWIEAQRAYSGVPALSIGVVHDQDRLWAAGFGQADPAAGMPATPATLYRVDHRAVHGDRAPAAPGCRSAPARRSRDASSAVVVVTRDRGRSRRRSRCVRGDERLASGTPAPGAAEDRLAVPPCDALGDVGGQIGEPRARLRRVLRHVIEPLRHVGVRAQHEAIRELDEE